MGRRMDRRGFWRELLSSALPEAKPRAPRSPWHAPAPRAAAAVFRPPGARPEPDFLLRCRPACRMCVDTCPVYALVPSYDPAQPGGGDGRPYLMPEAQACVLCGLCMHACPTGALRPTPARNVRIGTAILATAACVRSSGAPCRVCVERCPLTGRAIRDDDPYPRITATACTGCGLCAESCPPHAIAIHPVA